MRLMTTRLAGALALAALALAPARSVVADSIQLTTTSGTITPGGSVTITETYTNTGANATTSNGSGNGDIQLGAVDAGIVNINNTNFSVSGFQTGSFLSSNGLTLSDSTATSGELRISGFESNLTGPDVALNQTVTLYSFTLTAASNLAPGTYNVNLANPGPGGQATDVVDINGTNIAVTPTINNGTTFNSAYDVQLTVAAPAVPEPASVGMLSLAVAGVFFGRRKLRALAA